MGRSQAQKIFGTACKSFPKIAAPGPPRKQLSCGADRTSAMEEARRDRQAVAVTAGVSHGTFFSGPFATLGRSSREKLGFSGPLHSMTAHQDSKAQRGDPATSSVVPTQRRALLPSSVKQAFDSP